MKKAIECLMLLGLLIICPAQAMDQPSPKGANAIMDKIMKLEDSAMEEWRKGNPMRLIEISADDIIYIDERLNAPIVGKAAYIQYLEPLKGKIFYDASEYVKPKVALHGNTAVLTYNYHSLMKDKNGRLQRTSYWNTTEVYGLIGSEWKIVHTHWSHIQHSLPESLEMTIPILRKDASPLQGDAAVIFKRETAALERWRKGDPSGYLEIYAPDVTYFDSATPGRVNGLEAMKKKLGSRTGKIHYDVIDFVDPRIQVYGDTAVFFFRYLSTYLNPDGTIQKRTPWNCTEVYARIKGEWKIIHSHWSLINGQREGSGI